MTQTDTNISAGKGRLVRRIIFGALGRLLLTVLTVVLALALTLYAMLYMACHGPSEAARELFATTILETGALKWTAGLIMTDEEIAAVLERNAMQQMDTTMDDSLITIAADSGVKATVYSTLPSGMETTVKLRLGGEIVTSVVFGSVDFPVYSEVSLAFTGSDMLIYGGDEKKLLAVGSL